MSFLSVAQSAVLWSVVSLQLASTALASPREAALSAYRSGKHAQALAILDDQLTSNPKDPQLLLLKGVVLADTGRSKEAKTIFQNLIVDHPQLPEPYNNLAVLYAAEGDFDKARSVLEMAIKTNPSYATAYENLGDVYAKLASESYSRSLNLQPRKELQPKLRLINQVVALTPVSASSGSPATTPPATAATLPVHGSPAPSAAAPSPQSVARSSGASGNVDETVIQEARKAVDRWRRAWSARDIQAYIDSYVAGYTPPRGGSHQEWVNERTSRILPRRKIEVDVSDLQVHSRPDGTLQVRFVQHYRSDALDNRTRKELVLVQQGGRWLIASERTL